MIDDRDLEMQILNNFVFKVDYNLEDLRISVSAFRKSVTQVYNKTQMQEMDTLRLKLVKQNLLQKLFLELLK